MLTSRELWLWLFVVVFFPKNQLTFCHIMSDSSKQALKSFFFLLLYVKSLGLNENCKNENLIYFDLKFRNRERAASHSKPNTFSKMNNHWRFIVTPNKYHSHCWICPYYFRLLLNHSTYSQGIGLPRVMLTIKIQVCELLKSFPILTLQMISDSMNS